MWEVIDLPITFWKKDRSKIRVNFYAARSSP